VRTLGLATSIAALCVPVARAAAATQPVGSFSCQAKPAHVASPPPVAPPTPTGATAPAASAVAAPLCPAGELPVAPTGDAAKPAPPGYALSAAAVTAYTARFGARAARFAVARSSRAARRRRGHSATQGQFGAWYGYASGTARFPWQDGTYSWYGTQTNETPSIDPSPGAHSLSQLWGIDDTPGPTAFSDVEVGWNVDAQVNGDVHTHLFTFMFDRGTPGCYDVDTLHCPPGSRGYFQQYSSIAFPGMLVQAGDGSVHTYGAQQYGGNWWVYYDGEWVGYFPASSYPSYHNYGFLRLDMGNGRVPSTHASAHWQSAYRGYNGGSAWVSLSPTDTDPSAWNSGFYNTTGGFLYGGPGYAGC
jgi:hypothetical protein